MKKITIVFTLFCSMAINAQQFIVDSTFYISGWDRTIYYMAVMKDTLVITGGFDNAGGIPANLIVRYINGKFYPMGLGNTNGDVILCSAEMNSIEYYGGGFSSMGNVPYTRMLAGWDGQNYFSIGNCTSNPRYYAMTVWHDTLFVGGDQGSINGHQYWGIAAYDGSQWIDVGILEYPYALAVFNDEVYAVGGSMYIQRYKGGTLWESVGTTGDYAFDLKVDTINNFLYTTTGAFAGTINNIVPSVGVALWNGFYWEQVGYGNELTGTTVIGLYRGDVYIYSYNDSIGNDYTGQIARWDGQSWKMVGNQPGFIGAVNSMVVYNDTLYIGGGGYLGAPMMNGSDTLGYGITRWYMPRDTSCRYLKPRVYALADTFYMSAGHAQVQFYNNNAYVQTWDWDFGDGGSDNIKDPVHDYTSIGTYEVCVTVNDTGCVKTACKTITVSYPLEVNENEYVCGFKIFPNPASGSFIVELEGTAPTGTSLQLKITNMNGTEKATYHILPGQVKTEVSVYGWQKGTYMVCLMDNGKMIGSEKVVVE